MKRLRSLKLAIILAVGLSALLTAGSKGQGRVTTVRGTVTGTRPVRNATVALVEAAKVAASSSIQPLEDLARTTAFRTRTDSEGAYWITLLPGRYFIYVLPDASDGLHLPGGSASKIAMDLPAGQSALINIDLSERPPEQAQYVGTTRCLSCHTDRGETLATKHFSSLRQPGKTSTIMDLGQLRSLPRGFAGGVVADDDDDDENDFEESRTIRVGPSSNRIRPRLGYVDNDRSDTMTNGDYLTVTLEDKTYHIWFVYGGSVYEDGRQVFITKLDDTLSPIPLDDVTTPGSYYVLPFMYLEGNRRRRRWQPSYTFDQWVSEGVVMNPDPINTVDNQCIGCHAPVTALEGNRLTGFRAKILPHSDGQFDYDNDAVVDNINMNCESCHGPGSAHNDESRGQIVNPKHLGPAMSTLLCGRCHLRGEGLTEIDGLATGYPSNGRESLRRPPPWMLPSGFFGQPNGEDILPDFGTVAEEDGFHNPIDFGADAEHSWRDRRFGSRHNHSSWFYQDYQDFTRSRMYKNEFRLVNCFDCHDPHRNDVKADRPHQLRHRARDNVLCLGCHNGQVVRLGGFLNVTRAMVQQLEEDVEDETVLTTIATDILNHIKVETFELVGASMNLSLKLYNPKRDKVPVGRCTTCHMAQTISNGNEVISDGDGFIISGAIASHTFDVVSPLVSKNMAEAGLDPIPNACVVCHRDGVVDEPDFRFRPQ